jgi:hypothetical protein
MFIVIWLPSSLRSAGSTRRYPGVSLFKVPSPGVTNNIVVGACGRAVCQVPCGTIT